MVASGAVCVYCGQPAAARSGVFNRVYKCRDCQSRDEKRGRLLALSTCGGCLGIMALFVVMMTCGGAAGVMMLTQPRLPNREDLWMQPNLPASWTR